MPLTVSAVLDRAATIIQDQTNVRWPQTELLNYYNDARREIAIVRPDLYATTQVMPLEPGTKQTLPNGTVPAGLPAGSRFLDAIRNVAANDAIGKAVRVVEREVLDAQKPDWHTEGETTEIKHFMFDERTPRVFFVYPPAASGHKLEIAYSQTPTDTVIGNINTDTLDQEDIYAGAIVDYICYRAFSKDAEYAGNTARAGAHYTQFVQSLGAGTSTSMVVSPNTANVGGQIPRTMLASGG